MKLSRIGRLLALGTALLLGGLGAGWSAESYHLLKKYSIGQAEGSTREYFDYITVDSAARRVYLSHGTEIIVMDADSGALIGKITGLKQCHGVAVASEFGRGYISDGAQGKAIVFDLETLKGTGGGR